MAMISCSECGQMISDKVANCPHCGNPIAIATVETRPKIQPVFEKGKVVVCTRCRSQRVQMLRVDYAGQQGEKTKVSYSANLNPLKPFTFINRKERVTQRARKGIEMRYYQCLDCGHEFYANLFLKPRNPNEPQGKTSNDLSTGEILLLGAIAIVVLILSVAAEL